ncbi:cellulose binding domain-containing protein [Actinoplanes awajinensis]|uniref:Cellulose-binding protein n=1 Tax=Actinoplanes awajinensis subsp. mycoplanecinus TaxID=135947 RepID=A0A0X3VA83_9ACTN|nr:cellulose binding domain-containing protein [Actinoplanes awajinensis]KUL41719.1 cellulose-binding protein [Actinoplanes awajinensis subsp. mycoplanecinus]
MQRRRLAVLASVCTLVTGALFATATRADAATGCSVKYTVSSQWPGGFGAAVEVTNLGDPVTSWSLTFTFTAGQSITQLWNGSVSQSGTAVTVRNASWNGAVATGGTTSFGFNGAWTGTNPVPTAFALNGAACTGTVTPSGTPSGTPSSTPPAGAKTKIMALGDSITGSPGCWRALLWQKLPAEQVDFVGTLPGQGCGFAYDGENEGHGGYLVTNVASQNQLVGWLAATGPDVVLMHFGTNDVWSNLPTATILSAYTTLVGQMRAANPAMKILVAQIIPMNPSTCAECAQRVVTLNAAIPAWAAGLTTTASPITVVDQWTGFDTATDTYDGVHPNDAGNVKIANRWYPALDAALP